MSWECLECHHYTADGQKHDCVYERLAKAEAVIKLITTAAPRDDEHETAARSNYYRLRSSWNAANHYFNSNWYEENKDE